MVTDLWQRRQNKWLLQNSTSVVIQQCHNKVNFQRNGSGIVYNFSVQFSKGRKCSFMNRERRKPFNRSGKNINTTLEPFFENFLYFDVAGEE